MSEVGRDSTAAACVLVTGVVRCAALLDSQTRTAVFQRGADIPGRPLNGGQAANDRNDRAVLADSLASFREVPGIFGGLGTVRPARARTMTA